MVKLTLISIDALIDVPTLMANAFVRAFENKVPQARVLSLLAQKQCDEKRVAQVLTAQTGMQMATILQEFYRHLPIGAHTLTFDNAYDVLASTNQAAQGIFYGLPQRALQDIVRNANFVVDNVYGSRGGMTTLEVATEAASGKNDKDVCYIVGSITGEIPEFKVDGYKASRRLRASQSDLPVLLDELAKEE